jgi:hypothetical protein
VSPVCRVIVGASGSPGSIRALRTIRPLVQRGGPGLVLVGVASSADDVLVVGAGRRGALACPTGITRPRS